MFERLTDQGRQVVVLAQAEARLLQHNYIGTEHVLLGLAAEDEGLGGRALEVLGVSLEDARSDVEEVIGRGRDDPTGYIPFTPRAKKVMEQSLRESLETGHSRIGTEHILLALVRERDGVAAQVLRKRGVASVEHVRAAVMGLVARGPVPEREGAGRSRTASSLVQVMTTTETRELALELGHAAIDDRVAACVQVVGPITSVYRWKGAVEETSEFLCLLKTPSEGVEALAAFLRSRHPYDTPEITAVGSVFVDENYLAWAREETQSKDR